MPNLQVAPSILSANFGKLNDEIATVEPFCDMLHVDVMDGHFVPNISIGPVVVKGIKTALPLDCHLMISEPEKYISAFAEAGADSITVHQEVCEDLGGLVRKIKDLGLKAGVSLNPDTPVSTILSVLEDVDLVLIMSVNPGFGGQSFIESVVSKISSLREKMPELNIQVDGGINAETAKVVRDAGANILVAGSFIFGSEDREGRINELKS